MASSETSGVDFSFSSKDEGGSIRFITALRSSPNLLSPHFFRQCSDCLVGDHGAWWNDSPGKESSFLRGGSGTQPDRDRFLPLSSEGAVPGEPPSETLLAYRTTITRKRRWAARFRWCMGVTGLYMAGTGSEDDYWSPEIWRFVQLIKNQDHRQKRTVRMVSTVWVGFFLPANCNHNRLQYFRTKINQWKADSACRSIMFFMV